MAVTGLRARTPHHLRLQEAPSRGAGGAVRAGAAPVPAGGAGRLGHVALDGTKLKANASKHKAMSYGRMRSAEAALAAEAGGWRRPRPRMRARMPRMVPTGAVTSCRTGW